MTVTGTTSLLCLFQSKVEDAVTLVPGMNAEEKLKSVQFWNCVSGKLQDIVNNSAADINALAMKLEAGDKKVAFHIECGSTNTLANAGNVFSTDFVSDTSNYVLCPENSSQFTPEKLNASAPNDQFISSNGTSFAAICFPDSSAITTNALICMTEPTRCDNENDDCFPKSLMISEDCDGAIVVTSAKDDAFDAQVPQKTDFSESATDDICTKKSRSKKTLQPQMDCLPLVSSSEEPKSMNDSYLLQLLTAATAEGAFVKDVSKSAISELNDVQHSDTQLQESSLLDSNKQGSSSVEDTITQVSEQKDAEFVEGCVTVDNVNNLSFICDWCDQSFVDALNLSSHRMTHTKPFFCTECNAQFSCKGNLMVHFRKHTGEKPFSCSLCGAHFSTRGNLKRHLRSHTGLRPHECSHCGSCFTEKKSLIVHMRRHTGEKPYECDICGRRFSQSGILQSHMAVHLNERSHLCEHCGKAFRQKSQLRVHMLRHEGVRRYDCKQCNSRFLIKGDLERHKRVHTGERPFVCEICHKSFTRQQSLKEHLNRHYGLKPFKCKHCAKSFAEMSACYKHMKHHDKLKKDGNGQKPANLTEVSEPDTSVQTSSSESLHGNKINVVPTQNFTVIFQDCSPVVQVHSEFMVEKDEMVETMSVTLPPEGLTGKVSA